MASNPPPSLALHQKLRREKPDQATWTTADHSLLRLLKRYQTRDQRSFDRAFASLKHFHSSQPQDFSWQYWHELHRKRLAQALALPPLTALTAANAEKFAFSSLSAS